MLRDSECARSVDTIYADLASMLCACGILKHARSRKHAHSATYRIDTLMLDPYRCGSQRQFSSDAQCSIVNRHAIVCVFLNMLQYFLIANGRDATALQYT